MDAINEPKVHATLIHPTIYADSGRTSMLWKRIRKGMFLAEDHIGVRVGEGRINVDGASKLGGMVAGGGGVLRISTGIFIAAFSAQYGPLSSLVAEVRAMLDGLRMVYALSIPSLQVHCDSLLLVQGLQRQSSLAWSLFYLIQQLREFFSHTGWSVHYVFREANRVAVVLVNAACSPSDACLVRNTLPKDL